MHNENCDLGDDGNTIQAWQEGRLGLSFAAEPAIHRSCAKIAG